MNITVSLAVESVKITKVMTSKEKTSNTPGFSGKAKANWQSVDWKNKGGTFTMKVGVQDKSYTTKNKTVEMIQPMPAKMGKKEFVIFPIK